MITKINNANANAYKSLFLKADTVLEASNDDERIASLDEYFQNISTIVDAATVQGKPYSGLQYVVLPLDEPAFEIDANSRTITVPSAFQSNGISVQGDEGAEIVYFKIDRYFDATDLGADDTHIIIQWETAPDASGQATNGTSNALIRDIESEPGKLIFGWFLGSDITVQSGTIKFAVRIYKVNASNECTYNFSTLTAAAIVKPSLDLDLSVYRMIDTPEDWIKERLVDSPATDSTSIALPPVFVLDLVQYNLTDDNSLTELENGSKLLQVETKSGDGGVINYAWQKWEVTDPSRSATPGRPDGQKVYKVTADVAFKADSIYYRKRTANDVTYYAPLSDYTVGQTLVSYCSDKSSASDIITPTDIYQLFGECTVSSTGYYKVVATNRVGKSKNSQDSKICLVPGPTTIKAFNILPDSQGEKDKNPVAGIAHVFLQDKSADDLDGICVAKAKVDHDENNTTTWSWQIDGAADNAPALSTTDSCSIEIVEEDRKLYNKKYIVSVYDTRNKDVTETKTITYRVTDEAHEFPISRNITKIAGDDSGDIFTGAIVAGTEIDLANYLNFAAVLSDNVTYQWYGLKGTSIGDNDTLLDGHTDRTYTPASGGDIFCKVTNQLVDNDTVVSEKSFFTPAFHVVAGDN